jgi:hypothetical protein
MLAVLNKRWMSQGWRIMDPKDSEPMALTWIEQLDKHSIPYQHYFELYSRAIALRSRRLDQGLDCDNFSVDMMIACWPSLRIDLREREVAQGRTLTATASTQCLRCYGTGLEKIYDEDGVYLGTRPGCQHEYVDTSEPYASGIDAVIEANHINREDETAEQICSRVRQQLAHLMITTLSSGDQQAAWEASRTWAHAEKYCRENQ